MPLLLFYVHIVACMTMSYLSKYTFYLLDFVHVHESNCILVQIFNIIPTCSLVCITFGMSSKNSLGIIKN